MKIAALSLVVLAACGGSSRPAAPPAAPAANAEWADVLVEGATFELTTAPSELPDDPEVEPSIDRVTITVRDVVKTGDLTRAHLVPSDGFGRYVAAVQIGPAGVWFVINGPDDDEAAVFAGPPTFPAGVDKTLRDGDYDVVTRNSDGSVCYGWEPGPDAGECEEVCFADLCVAPGQGIVSGSGTWWPNAEPYLRVSK